MKKLLSLTLAAAIGLGSMNVQAAQESPEDLIEKAKVADLLSKRKYISPALQVGFGVLELAVGAVGCFDFFVFRRDNQRFTHYNNNQGKNLEDIEKLSDDQYGEIKQDYILKANILQKTLPTGIISTKFAKEMSLSGVFFLIHGIINIKNGLIHLKNVKRTQAMLRKLEKEQVQA